MYDPSKTEKPWKVAPAGSGGTTALAGLTTDVTITASSLAEGQVLRYDGTAGKWKNAKLGLGDLNNVDLTGLDEDMVLAYDGSKWIATTITAGGTLESATTTRLGGVKVYGVSSTQTYSQLAGTAEIYGNAAGQYRNYPVEMSKDNYLYVNVPWYAGSSSGGGGTTVSWGTTSGQTVQLNVGGTTKTLLLSGYSPDLSGYVTSSSLSSTLSSYVTSSTLTSTLNGYLKLTGGTMSGTINSRDIIPNTSGDYNLGGENKAWKKIYLGRNSSADVYLQYDSTNKCVRVINAGFAADTFVSAGGVAGSTTLGLGDLSGVDLGSTISDGQLLGYNATTSKWEPLVSGTPNNNDVLKYNSSTKKWVPTPLS